MAVTKKENSFFFHNIFMIGKINWLKKRKLKKQEIRAGIWQWIPVYEGQINISGND
jgi:hypothetical protein